MTMLAQCLCMLNAATRDLKGQQREMVFKLNPSYIVWTEGMQKFLKFVLLFTEIFEVLTH